MANLVKVKKNIDFSNYNRISYINRNKCATYTELVKLEREDSWSYLEVNEGCIVEESIVDDSIVEMLTRTWASFRGTTCIEDGRRLDIHSKRVRYD